MDQLNHVSNGKVAKRDNDRYMNSIKYKIRYSFNNGVKKAAKTASNLNFRKITIVEEYSDIDKNDWTECTSESTENLNSFRFFVVLLLNLDTRKFELIKIEFHPQNMDITVGSILKFIPFHSRTSLGKQKYSGLIRSKDGMLMVDPQENIMAKVGETLVAIPEDSNGNECACVSRHVLSLPDVYLSFDEITENNNSHMKKKHKLREISNENGILSQALRLKSYFSEMKKSSLSGKINWKVKKTDAQKSFPLSEVINYGTLEYSSLSSLDDQTSSDCQPSDETEWNFQEVNYCLSSNENVDCTKKINTRRITNCDKAVEVRSYDTCNSKNFCVEECHHFGKGNHVDDCFTKSFSIHILQIAPSFERCVVNFLTKVLVFCTSLPSKKSFKQTRFLYLGGYYKKKRCSYYAVVSVKCTKALLVLYGLRKLRKEQEKSDSMDVYSFFLILIFFFALVQYQKQNSHKH